MASCQTLQEESLIVSNELLSFSILIPPLPVHRLIRPAIRSKLPKDALVFLLHYCLLCPSEAIDLKPVLSKSTSLVEDHEIDSSANIDPWRRDTEDLSLFEP